MNAPDSSFPEDTHPQAAVETGPRRARLLQEAPAMAKLAMQLLRTPNALALMNEDDLRIVVNHMQLVSLPAGRVLMQEGDRNHTAYLLLMLEGEAKVESNDGVRGPPLDISIMGPGNIIGEMGLLDGAPRSTTCTSITQLQVAALSRRAMQLLIDKHPRVGALLMVALAKRMADRLRALGDQLHMYADLAQGRTPNQSARS